MKTALLGLLLSAAATWPAAAQVPAFDSSGNGMLKGTYYFREVFYIVGDGSGDLQDSLALFGNITFSGSGTYTGTATLVDSSSGTQQSGPLSGTYTISASGHGFISNPLSSGDAIFGLVSQNGVFVGSSTDNSNGFNDMFIAAQLASPAPTSASFKGSYSVSYLDLSLGSPLDAIGELFQLNPDGAGNLGNVALSGYFGQNGSSVINQTAPGVRYSFQNGAAIVTFPTSNSLLVTGQEYLYFSPDGNFFFGGSPFYADMLVGVRTASGSTPPNLNGLYYQAGVDEDDSQLASGFGDLDSYFGAFYALSGGGIIGHQRLEDVFNPNPVDYTYSDSFNVKSDGTYSTTTTRYVVGANGVRIGSGIGPFLGLNVALPAPALTGTGVYLNPQGIQNAASFAPFTASIAPGEQIFLSGSGLSNDPNFNQFTSLPLPTTLAGVQVMINGVAAPIYYVRPDAISVLVPYSTTTPIAQIQVINNGAPSNIVTVFTSNTAPGIFGGLGEAAALHSDYSVVTSAHPAQIGETVSVYLTGLGAVIPAVPDGSVSPTSPFSTSLSTITAYVGGVQASVGYAGLAPGLAPLYQVNLTIPTGLTAGDNRLEIFGPDSYTSEAVISVAAASSEASPLAVTTAAPASRSVLLRMRQPGPAVKRSKNEKSPRNQQAAGVTGPGSR